MIQMCPLLKYSEINLMGPVYLTKQAFQIFRTNEIFQENIYYRCVIKDPKISPLMLENRCGQTLI